MKRRKESEFLAMCEIARVAEREQSVIHIVAEDLQDCTARLNTLRERTGQEDAAAAKPRSHA